MKNDIFSQSPFRCKFDWGPPGVSRAASRGDIIVVVDVLSFSTTVAYAVSRGAIIYPLAEAVGAADLARQRGADVAVGRSEAISKGCYSLSPLTFDKVQKGEKVILPSLNGGTCCQHSNTAAHIFAGALVNASAVAKTVTVLMTESQLDVTVVACGEREKEAPYDLRPAIEDSLGAGAVLSKIPFDKSSEAQVCAAAYLDKSEQIDTLLWECTSGRELRAAGFEDDVRFAARTDSINVVPALTNGTFSCHNR